MSRAERKPSAVRRAELAAVASELALREGLSAVTLRGVAARAGVAPALVAHYHPSMDGLVADAFTAVVSAELAEVRSVLDTASGAAARLAMLLGTLLDGTRDDVTTVWVEAWALGRRSDSLAQAVRRQMDAWQTLVEGILVDGVADGEFATEDPSGVAWQLLGMIDGVNAQSLVRWAGAHAGDRSMLLARALEGMLGLRRGALSS
jgi:AcrR family transcriptional regulator